MPLTLAWLSDTGHRDYFAKSLNAQRQAGQFCDVLLKIAGRTLPTHACVLSACSPVFRELILADRPNAPYLCSSPQEIELVMPSLTEVDAGHRQGIEKEGQVDNDGLEAMVDLLDYIYTGYITLKNDSVDLVVKLAEAFALEGLCSLIKSHLCDRHANVNVSAKPSVGSRRKCPSSKRKRRKKRLAAPVLAARDRPAPKVSVPAAVSATQQRTGRAPHRFRKVSFDLGDEVAGSEAVAGNDVFAAGNDHETNLLDDPNYEPDRDSLIGHLRYVHPEVVFKCGSCDFSNEQCGKMLEHLRQAEHPETECSLCSSVLPDRAAFLQHLTWHDTHVRPYFCRMCPYHGKTPANLAAHVAKHAVERPYKCDECGRGFKWSTSLKIHKLSHRTDRMHLCDQCGYSTAYFNNLRVHKRKHNGGMFPCSTCSYQAYHPYHLRRHELTHAKLRDVICETCGNCFSTTKSLKEHSKLHNLETSQLFCHLCPYKTLRIYRLKSHMERSHPHEDPNHLPVDVQVVEEGQEWGGASQFAHHPGVAFPEDHHKVSNFVFPV